MSGRGMEEELRRPPAENGRGLRRQAPGRERCPTCGATRRDPERDGSLACHRCATDLSLLVAVETEADRLRDAALEVYRCGRYRTALARAAEARRLHAADATTRLLAVSALRSGDFRLALEALRAEGFETVGDSVEGPEHEGRS